MFNDPVAYGQGNDDGNNYHSGKLARKKVNDTKLTGTQYFPDADFLAPSFSGEGSQTKQTQAGDQDGQSGKVLGQGSNPLFGGILSLIRFIQKFVIERKTGVEFFIKLPKPVNGLFFF